MPKKYWAVLLTLILCFAFIGCESEDASEEEIIPESRQDEIKLLVDGIVKDNYQTTSIKEITINDNLGSEEEDDYIALIYLSFDAKNTKTTTQEMIEMYGSDLAAKLADEKDISEITIFWEVPYLKEGSNVAKFNLQRSGDEMVFEEKWFDAIFE